MPSYGGVNIFGTAVTMSTAGSYGFRCAFHPGTMFGAIQVVP